jgi:phospholipase/carboxylesterase
MLTLIDEFLHHGVMYLAPQAANSSWYPRSSYDPLDANEPWLSSGLERISAAFEIAAEADVPPERTLICGFSQGGCLASEFVAQHPQRYGGLIVLSGSLLGPEIDRDVDGAIEGTPVFFGCSDADPYVPAERVVASAQIFEQLDGDVEYSLYAGLGHAINDDEIQQINNFIEQLS